MNIRILNVKLLVKKARERESEREKEREIWTAGRGGEEFLG